MKPSVVFVGEESVGLRVLRGLNAGGADVQVVLSDGPVGRLAETLGYDVLPADRVTDPSFAADIGGADLLLNVHSLHIVPEVILDAPRLGSYNVHPGPLPEYAGLNTPCWAIYEGATEYGVTVHRMVGDIDAGSIAYETRWPLTGSETGLSLWTRCSEEGVTLVEALMEQAQAGREIPRQPQDLSRRRYYGSEVPREGRIEWTMEAEAIERFVRACEFGPFRSPWGRPKVSVEGTEKAVLEVEILDRASSGECGRVTSLGDGRFEAAAADRWLRIRVDR